MKVLMMAFGNPDNVLSLCKNISAKIDLTLIFVLSGKHFRQGVLDINLELLSPGLHTDKESIRKIFGDKITDYISDNFRLWLLKTNTRKFLHKKTGIGNFISINSACKIINSEKFDIIHYNGTSGFLLYFLHRLKIKNRFWTLHDYKPHSGEENLSGDILNRFFTKYRFKYIQHYEYLAKEFADYYKINSDEVFCVNSGAFDVYNAFDNNERLVDGKYILFLGRISRYKGLKTLLNSYRLVPENNETSLVVAGEGNLSAEETNYDGVKILNDYISPANLVSLIKNAEFIVTPYQDTTHSGVVMTAFNFGKPVIASNLEGLSEVVVHNRTGLLFRKDDEQDLRNQLIELLDNKKLLNDFAANIDEIKLSGILSWKKISSRMLALYSGSLAS
jgi:glycosyltransferase involved in cell wall biosynthesis